VAGTAGTAARESGLSADAVATAIAITVVERECMIYDIREIQRRKSSPDDLAGKTRKNKTRVFSRTCRITFFLSRRFSYQVLRIGQR
jgi:hypothetical protein